VTLSDRKIRKQLGRKFVCTWGNVEGNPNAGSSFAHKPSDPPSSCIRGNGEHNIQILFLTPEGELMSALAGYLSPKELHQELDQVLDLWKQLGELPAKSREVDVIAYREKLVRDHHRRFLADFEKQKLEGRFASFVKSRVVKDHEFSAKHALMDARTFRPEAMVGNAKTFFGGSTGGTKPGRIGDGAKPNERKRKH